MRANLKKREFYIPNGATKVKDPKSDAVIYLYDCNTDRPAALAFHGRAQKPDWHNCFKSKETRGSRVERFFEHRRKYAQFKKETKEKNLQPHNWEVGKILYSSWGYDQTNIDFYQVTKIIGKRTVEIRKIRKTLESSRPPCDYVIPKPGCFDGEPKKKRVSRNAICINSSSNAYPWDGTPKYQTSSGWGH